VVRIVREARAEDRVLLSSFNPLCLWRAKRFAKELPRALLFESDAQWVLRSAVSAAALSAEALHPEDVLATPARIARWRSRGYRVSVWTVDDPQEAARLVESGATGIITNRPAVMRERFG
jgi:glycerophosphoryl diester phosphodiesterase